MTLQIPTNWMNEVIEFGITLPGTKKPLTICQWYA